MSKRKRKIDSKQLSIFDYLRQLSQPHLPTEGQFRIIEQLRAAMRAAMKACPLDRYQIAGEMSHLLGETITKEIIDSWTRESDEQNGRYRRHIPAEFLPAFCQVTGCNDPLVIMGQLVGLFILPGPEALRAEIERLDEEAKKIRKKKKERMVFLKEMEKGVRS